MTAQQQSSLSGDVDARIAELAARQHGAVSRKQLLAVGLPAHQIDYRMRRGRLATLHRGVYRVGPVPGRYQREMAAVLAGGLGTVVGGRSAAALAGLVPAPRAGAPVCIVTVRDLRIRDRGIRIHRCRSLPADEITEIEGVPATAPARTLLDFAATATDRELELALARALRGGLAGPGELEGLLRRHPRVRGRPRLARLIDAGCEPALTRSEAERRVLEMIRLARLAPPKVNAIVEGYEVDFLWPTERLVVEVDGKAFHSGDPAFERDRSRDADLAAAGYTVMRVTWRQIENEPRLVVDRLRRALERRRPASPRS